VIFVKTIIAIWIPGNRVGANTKQAGQSVVEFAILLPVFLLMLLGLIEWGFLLWTRTTFANAVREGARESAVITDWGTNFSARQTEIRNLVIDRLQGLPTSETSGISGRIAIGFTPNITSIQSITVSIENQPYVPVIGFTSVAVPATLTASAEFRFEGGM
jgi:Flp pilus assembly protein TadG